MENTNTVNDSTVDCSTNTTNNTKHEFDDPSLSWNDKLLAMVDSEYLPLVKDKGSEYQCVCPVCGDDNLTISKSGRGYTCWTGKDDECQPERIREALIPASGEFKQDGNRIQTKNQEVFTPAKLPEEKLEFAIADSTKTPGVREHNCHGVRKYTTGKKEFDYDKIHYTEYKYEGACEENVFRSRQVQRREYSLNGKKIEDYKEIRPQHQTAYTEGWLNGKDKISNKSAIWSPYHIEEVRANAKEKIVLGVEGEKNVEYVRSLGLGATTFQGSDWSVSSLELSIGELKQAEVGLLFYFADNDKIKVSKAGHEMTPTGEVKRQNVAIAAAKAGLPCIAVPITVLNPDAPQNGYDIANFIDDQRNLGRSDMEIRSEIEEKVQAIAAEEVQKQAEENKNYEEKLFDRMVQACLSGLSTDKLFSEKLELKREAKNLVFGGDFDKLWNRAEQKAAFIENIELTIEKIEQSLALESASLDLEEILPTSLAKPIKEVAKSLTLRAECFLLAFITGISGQHKNGTTIELRYCKKNYWRESLAIFAAIIGESGEMKSVILKLMVERALTAVKTKAQAEISRQKREYDKKFQEWKNGGQKGEEPEFPDTPEFIIGSYTKEALEEVCYLGRSFGLTISRDEIAGLFGDLNSRTGGKGSDRQFLLSLADGAGINTKYRSRTNFVPTTQVSIIGTIQPEVLKKLMGNGNDDDGMWARWLFCSQPISYHKIDPDEEWGSGVSIDIDELIEGVYANINKLPKGEYNLRNDKARRLFNIFNNYCNDKKKECEHNALLRHTYSKLPKLTAKIMGNLHVIHHVVTGKVPPKEIQPEIVCAAIKCAKFFMNEALKVGKPEEDEFAGMSEMLSAVIRAAKEKEWITPSDAKNKLPSHKREATPITDCQKAMRDLKEMDLGECRKKRTLEFRLNKRSHQAPSQEDSKLDKYYDIRNMVIVGQDISELESASHYRQAPVFQFDTDVINRYKTDAKENEKDEPFDFESNPYNNPDLQPATPKGSDREPEQAVAGDRTATEAEAVESEEAAVEPQVTLPEETETETVGTEQDSVEPSETCEVATASTSEPEPVELSETCAVACDWEQAGEPDTVTVDDITYRIGEIVNYVFRKKVRAKAKVVGKGWAIDTGDIQEKGVTIEFQDGWRDTMTHINGNEWIIAPGTIRSVHTIFLRRLEPEQLFDRNSNELVAGETVTYKCGTEEYADVNIVGKSDSGDIVVHCVKAHRKHSPKVGDMVSTKPETLWKSPF